MERREFEYLRHGTQALLANFEVATGQVVTPSLVPSRTEADFATHIDRTVATDPATAWVGLLRFHRHLSTLRQQHHPDGRGCVHSRLG